MIRPREVFFVFLSVISFLIVCGAIGTMIIFLSIRGLPSVFGAELFFGDTPPLDAMLGLKPVWDGIWPAIAGTFSLLCLTMLLAIVPGAGCGVFLACYASPRQKYLLGLAVDLLAGIPSIVMGIFGLVLIIQLRRTFLPEGTTCLLLAAFCLSLLVLPSLVAGTRAALESLPDQIYLTACALGFTRGQAVWHFLLPAAARGILGGVMLAIGRAAEDTAVIMLTGAVSNAGLPAGIAAKFEALPFLIYCTAAQYSDQSELARGFGASVVLLFLSGMLMLCSWLLQRKLDRRWRGYI